MAQTVQGGEELDPEDVGNMVAQAVQDEQFLVLPDAIHTELIRRRSADLNAFVEERLRGAL